jgi:hypothetical protein
MNRPLGEYQIRTRNFTKSLDTAEEAAINSFLAFLYLVTETRKKRQVSLGELFDEAMKYSRTYETDCFGLVVRYGDNLWDWKRKHLLYGIMACSLLGLARMKEARRGAGVEYRITVTKEGEEKARAYVETVMSSDKEQLKKKLSRRVGQFKCMLEKMLQEPRFMSVYEELFPQEVEGAEELADD